MHLYNITLEPHTKGAIAGIVTIDIENEKYPLNNIKIWLISKESTHTFTNCDGEFVFYDLPDDSYQLKIHSPGFKPLSQNIIIRDSTLINLDLSLEPKSENDIIYGRVTDSNGNFAKHTFIGVYKNKKLIATTKTNEQGQYVVSI